MANKTSNFIIVKYNFLTLNLLFHSQKINQLEEEQSKKSTSTDDHDPRRARNGAIKKLLIKNLKLAAMIATKEIQLEETKARSLSSKYTKLLRLCNKGVS